MLLTLEISISIIQAYAFSILLTLYFNESYNYFNLQLFVNDITINGLTLFYYPLLSMI